MKFTAEQAATLHEILRWRRDMRHFLRDPLPEARLARLRQAMDLAPSVGNSRPWRVIRVRDAGLRAQVRDEFERCNAAAAAGYDAGERSEYLQLKLAGLDMAPEQLAIFTDMDPAEGRGLGRRTMALTLHQSTAMAMHNLWLTARAENIGVGIISILEPERIERIFDVPAHWKFSAYLCMGRPAFDDDTPLLQRNGWQENIPTWWEER